MNRHKVKKRKKDKKVFTMTAQLSNPRNFHVLKRGGVRL